MFSSDDNMRLFTVEHSGKTVPATDVKGAWQKASSKTVREFSATAYYFGKTLRTMLNVPVGLVVSSYGGWRELNGNNLPFFFCQIAPYDNYKVNSAPPNLLLPH